MRVHFYGVPNKEPKKTVVGEGMRNGIRYTITRIDDENDTDKDEPEKEKD